jgi:hypothetical protein
MRGALMMSGANTSAWVLITGVIRDENFLLSRLNFFFKQKQAGHIEQLVFSTWKGEIEKFDAVVDAMRDYEFILAESDQPDIVCDGHYIHQMVSLKNGLEVCPDNQFILRTRTDKCGPESGVIEEEMATFLQNKNYVRKSQDEFDIFDYKIGTFASHTEVSNNAPALFFWNDRHYFGLKEDLLKFTNYNVLAFGYQNLIPEQALFSAPFLQKWPVFSFFFRGLNQKEVINKIFFNRENSQEKIEALTTYLVSSRLFRRAFLTEKYLLHKYFFDIRSGADFEFNTKYRGIDIQVDQGVDDALLSFSRKKIKRSDYSTEIDEISLFLQENFSINPVTTRILQVGDFARHEFNTPSSNISIIS